MTFRADLKSQLQGTAAISALTADRIWPVKRFSETLPAVTYQVVAGVPQNDLDGSDGTLDNIRVQIDCWASTYDGAQALAAEVRTAMQAFAKKSVLLLQQDFYEDETRIHRVLMDFSCWHRG